MSEKLLIERLKSLAEEVSGPTREAMLDAAMALAENDSLAAQLAEAEKDAALDREIAQRNRDAVHELTERLAEAERDAKRYRWLRTNREEGFWKCHEKDLEGGQVLKYGTDLDAAIDAARATDSATPREDAP